MKKQFLKISFSLSIFFCSVFNTKAGWFYEHKYIGDMAFKYFVSSNHLESFLRDSIYLRQYGYSDKELIIPYHLNYKVINYYAGMFGLTDGESYYSYGDLCGLSGDHSVDAQQLCQGLFDRAIFEKVGYSAKYYILKSEVKKALESHIKGIDIGLREGDYFNLKYLFLAKEDRSHFQRPPLSFEQMLSEDKRELLQEVLDVVMNPHDSEKYPDAFREKLADDILNLDNSAKYALLHLIALHFMTNAAIDYCNESSYEDIHRDFAIALIFNSFADHFLQDGFAAGHLPVKRNIFGLDNNGIHDFYNRIGLHVKNESGESWTAYGDNFYDDTTFAHAIQANISSLQELWNCFDSTRKVIWSHREGDDICNEPLLLLSDCERLISNQNIDLPKYLHEKFRAFKIIPIPLSKSEYKDIKLKHGSKNGMYIDAGYSHFVDDLNSSVPFEWNVGIGLIGYSLTKPDKSSRIFFSKKYFKRESLFWLGLRLNYSRMYRDDYSYSKYLFVVDVTINDRIAFDIGTGLQTNQGNHFLFSPSIGYELKWLRLRAAPSLKIYEELSPQTSPETGVRLSIRLY